METTVLLVEDDENLAFMLAENLEIEGFDVLRLRRGEDVESTVQRKKVDIVLMDVDLDGKLDGFQVAEGLRESYPELPIIFTTGKTHFRDTERGLRMKNVDYQKKPYGSRELVARMSNLLRRTPVNDSKIYSFRGFSFNAIDHIILIDNKEIRLTKTEALFLSILCDNINSVVTKETMSSHLWGKEDTYPKDHSLNNLSHRIRKCLDGNHYLELRTVSKVGYRLMEKK